MIQPVTVVICSKRHYCGTSGIQTLKFWMESTPWFPLLQLWYARSVIIVVPAEFKPSSSGWNLHHDFPCYSCNILEASLLWYQRNSNPQVLDGIYTMISPVTVVIYSKRHYCGTSGIQTYKFWIKLRQISMRYFPYATD
jgi:hypothetical protein